MYEGRLLDRGLPRISVLSPKLLAKQALRKKRAVEIDRSKATQEATAAIVSEAKQEASRIIHAAMAEADAIRTKAEALFQEAEITRRQAFIVLTSKERPTVRAIINEVSSRYQLRSADIIGPRRTRLCVIARFEAISLAHINHPELSLPALGRLFGNRDHTSILHALRKTGAYRTGKAPSGSQGAGG